MKLGFVPVTDRNSGGIWQYSETILAALRARPDWLQVVVVLPRADPETAAILRADGWAVTEPRSHPSIERLLGKFARAMGRRSACRVSGMLHALTGIDLWPYSAPDGVDMMLYPSPWQVAVGLPVRYVVAVHDVHHRLQPQFPELSVNGEVESRERLFIPSIEHASAILVDSQVGGEDVLGSYAGLTTPDRVRVLPFVPPPYLSRPTLADLAARLAAIDAPERYLLMPAQLWPHKNHMRVAQAVAALRDDDVDVAVLMTGSTTGEVRTQTAEALRAYIESAGLGDRVRLLGYVDDPTMAALYAGAVAVLLPTFLGPTNIPVIEAWAMGIPVLTSDIRGIREQCGDAAVLVDPASVDAIAVGIRRLWSDEFLRRRLAESGRERYEAHDAAQFRRDLLGIIAAVAGRSATEDGLGRP